MASTAIQPVHLKFEIDQYLDKMDKDDQLSLIQMELKNPLNESFENECLLSEGAQEFLKKNSKENFLKLDRYVFNNLTLKKRIIFKKITGTRIRDNLCLALSYRLSLNNNKKIMVIFKNEIKALKYFNQIKEQNPNIQKDLYFGRPSSIIINDKKALQKPLKICFFSLPRFSNLLGHKSIEFGQTSCVLFLDTNKIIESNKKEFEDLVENNRKDGKDCDLIFVSRCLHTDLENMFSDYFSQIAMFENNMV